MNYFNDKLIYNYKPSSIIITNQTLKEVNPKQYYIKNTLLKTNIQVIMYVIRS